MTVMGSISCCNAVCHKLENLVDNLDKKSTSLFTYDGGREFQHIIINKFRIFKNYSMPGEVFPKVKNNSNIHYQ